jgi:thiaminase
MELTFWTSGCKVRFEFCFARDKTITTYVCVREGDSASLLMALAACLLGYGEVGLWLQREARRPQSWVQIENNPYKRWIELYSGDNYQAAVKVGLGA